jgi:hypothetical protein
MTRHVLRALALSAAAAAAALAAPAAHAGLLAPSARDCAPEVVTKPFLPWLDLANYIPVGDGGFEAGAAGWSLSGARVVDGNEPWRVRAPGDRRSLAVQEGTAVTPEVCVGLEHPTLRFFARNTGSPLGALAVSVLVRTSLGTTHAEPVGVVADPGGAWAPRLPMPLVANLLPLLPGERTTVRLRFDAVGAGSAWQIDDVYVDPYSKR